MVFGIVNNHGGNGVSRGALRRSEERFRLLVESVVDYAIFMLDPNGIVQSWNTGAERLKGYREGDIVGQHYSVFYTPEAREAGLPERLLKRASEEGSVSHSGWRVRQDGSRFWADVVITALFEETGEHTGFAKVTRDMTEVHLADEAREQALAEERRAVARLEDLDKWRVEFISSMVHDLQTPVTGIAGFVELLLNPEGESEEVRREFLELIRSNARSLQELIDNLRANARLSERRVELVQQRFDLRALLTRLVADMAPLFDKRSIDCEVEDLEVTADPRALERVVRNLLSNAARHTPSGTAIHVRAHRDTHHVVVEIADEGPGISEELRSRMFERFQSGARGGTGLGLSIARRYVELHGGTISVHSTDEAGTTMRFTIPQPSPDPAGASKN